jgi:hypothetical protein
MQWRIDGVDGKENFVILSNDSNRIKKRYSAPNKIITAKLDGDVLYIVDSGRSIWVINVDTGARRKIRR